MKKLIIVNAFKTTLHFSEKIEEYFNNRFGEAEVVDIDTLGSFPAHDRILLRCGFPKDGYYGEDMRRHARSHGCITVNNIQCIENGFDKYISARMAKDIIKTPITVGIGRYEIESRRNRENVAREINFPAFLKPRYSSGGKNIKSYGSAEKFVESTDYENLSPNFIGNWIVQEAITFDKLIRAVWIEDVGLVDAVYDVPDAGKKYTITDKLGDNCRIYHGDRGKLARTCEAIAKKFGAKHLVVDLFEKDGEFIFNEVNNATNLWWLNKISGVRHALLLAELMNRQ